MASDGDEDYLRAYQRFFADFLAKVNPDDQLPIKTSGHDIAGQELVGEIIHMTLEYLDQQLCPPSLQCYLVRLAIEEIKAICRKQPETCGYRSEEKTYAPLKLMQAVTRKVNEICQRHFENSRLALLAPPPSTTMPLATAFAIKNNRRKMEDRHVILHDLNTIFKVMDDSIASYYAVFDGHAGYHAAVFCATRLHQYLAESHHYPRDPERALRDAFLTTDASFIEKSTRQALSSGTTAVCALILKKKLYVAWVGDSQAALSKRGEVTQLVNPHKPDRNDERDRVEEMGGTVMHLGTWRVNGNLAVSRAIGDAAYKPYVTGEPEIRCITLDGQEDFLIIACDGLWDCVTENEAATLVYRDLYRDPRDWASTSQHLVEYAKSQDSVDNITVIVVFLSTPRQIVSRCATYGNPLLADVQMNNMEPDNRYLSNANGHEFESSAAAYAKQPSNANEEMADEDFDNYWKRSSNGKASRENGSQIADYDAEDNDDDDLGPETDVDAVDDASEPVTGLANVSRQLFTDKADLNDDNYGDERIDDPPSPSNDTKLNQQVLIPEAENVGDSEDSEDEWNYYRIDPNKEKEEIEEKEHRPEVVEEAKARAAGFSPLPRAENEVSENLVISSSEPQEEVKIDHQEEQQSSKNSTDSGSDSESEREIRTEALIDTEINVDTNFESNFTQVTESTREEPKGREEKEEEREKVQEEEEEEEKKIRDDEENKENSELTDMDFQLNPNAAEFVPVSPTSVMQNRIELDMPIAGSPLKRTPPMDDIKLPSMREFESEIRQRPHEFEEKSCANGKLLETLVDSPEEKVSEGTASAVNLDDSEISSTKAEFGDESSFLTTSEFHRTGVSVLDSSYTGSYTGFEDSALDPMTKSFGPGELGDLTNPVDLNAVRDITDADALADEFCTAQQIEETEKNNQRNVEIDTEYNKVEMDKPLEDEPISPLNSSCPRSILDEASSKFEYREKMEISSEDALSPSSKLSYDAPEFVFKQTEQPSTNSDDFESIVTQSESYTVLNTSDANSVTAKLQEMDLEDRGSQDCGFEKYNEKSDIDDDDDDERKIASNEQSSECLLQENIVESSPMVEEKEESSNTENLPETIQDLHASENLVSSQHSGCDAPVLHNPLDLNVVPSSTMADNDVPVADDSFRGISDTAKVLESPEVGLSPLVHDRTKNPFDPMEFTNLTPHVTEQEAEFMASINEAEKVEALQSKSPVEQNPIIQSPEEQKNLIETDDSANNSIGLKLSESLQEFTGLEQELNPVKENNSTAVENLLDIANEENKEASNILEVTKMITDEVENNITELISSSEAKTEEKAELMEKASAIVASVGATVAAVGAVAATKTTKAKPAAKGPPKSAAAKSLTNKSNPTSPTKSVTATSRTSASTTTKKAPTATSTLTRPTKLETGKTGLSSTTASAKSNSTTAAKAPATKPTKTIGTTAGRLTAAPKPKPTSAVPAKSTTEKKPTTNGEITKSATSKTSSTSTRVSTVGSSKPLVKSSTVKSTTTTTTSTTTTARSRPVSSTTATKLGNKTATTTAVGTTGTTTQRPKTAPATGTSNLTVKSRLSSVTKSPITEKQIKETANKQISSSRTTTASNKTNRLTAVSSSVTTTKRTTSKTVTNANSTTNTGGSPAPIKKPATSTRLSKAPTANGKTHEVSKTTTTATKTKVVVENGVCTAKQELEVVTSTVSNEEDVPKKDISPIEPPADNQLIMTAD